MLSVDMVACPPVFRTRGSVTAFSSAVASSAVAASTDTQDDAPSLTWSRDTFFPNKKHKVTKLANMARRLQKGRSPTALAALMDTRVFNLDDNELPDLRKVQVRRGAQAHLDGNSVFIVDSFTRQGVPYAYVATILPCPKACSQDEPKLYQLGWVQSVRASELRNVGYRFSVAPSHGGRIQLHENKCEVKDVSKMAVPKLMDIIGLLRPTSRDSEASQSSWVSASTANSHVRRVWPRKDILHVEEM